MFQITYTGNIITSGTSGDVILNNVSSFQIIGTLITNDLPSRGDLLPELIDESKIAHFTLSDGVSSVITDSNYTTFGFNLEWLNTNEQPTYSVFWAYDDDPLPLKNIRVQESPPNEDCAQEVWQTYDIHGSDIYFASVSSSTPLGTWSYKVVPIPGAVWLLGSGFIGLLGIRKQFSN